MSKDAPDERDAQALVAATLGVDVLEHDDNSLSGMFDFSFELDGASGALEVTRDTDAEEETRQAAFWKHSQSAESAVLNRSWTLMVAGRRPRFRGMMSRIEGLLADVEAAGYEEFSDSDCYATYPDYREPLPAILTLVRVEGIQHGVSYIASEGGVGVNFAIANGGTSSGPDEVVDAIEALIAEKTDLAPKLGTSGCEHRILLVRFHPYKYGPYRSMAWDNLPTRAPRLPPEITEVWTQAQADWGWRWTESSGWHRVPDSYDFPEGKIEPPLFA